MKNVFCSFVVLILFGTTVAQTNDWMLSTEFRAEKKKITDQISKLKKNSAELKNAISIESSVIDSLTVLYRSHSDQISAMNDTLILLKNRALELEVKAETQRFPYFIIALVVLIILMAVIAYMFVKFRKKTISTFLELKAEDTATRDQATILYKSMQERMDVHIQEVTTGFAETHARHRGLEEQIQSSNTRLEGKIATFTPEFSRVNEALAKLNGNIESQAINIKNELENIHQKTGRLPEIEATLKRLGEDVKAIKTKPNT